MKIKIVFKNKLIFKKLIDVEINELKTIIEEIADFRIEYKISL